VRTYVHVNNACIPAGKGPKVGRRTFFYTRRGRIAVDHHRLGPPAADVRIPHPLGRLLVWMRVGRVSG
jgi:hypothetical protein